MTERPCDSCKSIRYASELAETDTGDQLCGDCYVQHIQNNPAEVEP